MLYCCSLASVNMLLIGETVPQNYELKNTLRLNTSAIEKSLRSKELTSSMFTALSCCDIS
jgi:hypothetical protein